MKSTLERYVGQEPMEADVAYCNEAMDNIMRAMWSNDAMIKATNEITKEAFQELTYPMYCAIMAAIMASREDGAKGLQTPPSH